MPYDPIIVKVKTDKTTAVVASSGGASFGVVNVTGQNNVVATKTTDILKVSSCNYCYCHRFNY